MCFCIFRGRHLQPGNASTSRISWVSLAQASVLPYLSYLGSPDGERHHKGEISQAPSTDEMLKSSLASTQQVCGQPSAVQCAGDANLSGLARFL